MNLRPTVAAIAAALLLAAAVGFFVGRWAAPARIEVRERVVTKTVEVAAKTTEQTSDETKSAARRDETQWRYRYVQRPDGTVVTTASSHAVSDRAKEAHREEAKREAEIRFVDKYIDREVVKVVEAQAATWSGGIGTSILGGLGSSYRAEVARRVIGPIWLGVYADTSKAAGLSLRVEF